MVKMVKLVSDHRPIGGAPPASGVPQGAQTTPAQEEEPMANEWRCGEYVISTDRVRLDLAMIHGFLSTTSYWAQGIPAETVARSIEHSLSFGVYNAHQQVGFARVITDYATFSYVADVF